jgi:F420-dependent oxidoreductase-like protein
MKLGLQIPIFTWPGGPAQIGETFGRIVQNAEAAGFASVWVMDHFFQIGNIAPKELEMLEGYSALSYAAALTKRVKLGTLVTGITYRYPGILVKTATTLDVLSGGRAYFGVGAAWNEEEHVGLGVPFPPLKERFEILEETLQLAHQMWSGEAAPFESKHLHLAEALNSPNTLQPPHPPIMIGGTGEEKTFRLIAKYGDACNIFVWQGLDYIRQKYEVLRRRCDEVGRPWNEIEKTTLGSMLVTPDGQIPPGMPPLPMPARTPSQAIEYFHQLAEIGTDQAIFSLINAPFPDAFEVWANEIIPAVEKFVPAGR